METTHAAPPVWVSFVPLIVIAVPFLVTMLFLARRKGKSLVAYFLLGLIPGVNMLAALWLASQTDASVKAELEDLRRRLLDGNRAICTQCGGAFNIEQMISHGNHRVCAHCKPIFLQKLAEGAPVERSSTESRFES